MFSVSDHVLVAKFKIKTAQLNVQWSSLLYRSSLGNTVGDMDVRGDVDVDVWGDGNATDHDSQYIT